MVSRAACSASSSLSTEVPGLLPCNMCVCQCRQGVEGSNCWVRVGDVPGANVCARSPWPVGGRARPRPSCYVYRRSVAAVPCQEL
eukprot:347668-Pyramimonas_sp.AAC.1